MVYKVERSHNNKQLTHALEGEKMKNHKYIARVNLPNSSGKKKNNYLYFYSMSAYQAYLKNKNKTADTKTAQNDVTSKKTVVTNSSSKSSNIVLKTLSSTNKKAENTVAKGVQAVQSKLAVAVNKIKSSDSKKDNAKEIKVTETKKNSEKVSKSTEVGKKYVGEYLSVNGTKKVNEVTKDTSGIKAAASKVADVLEKIGSVAVSAIKKIGGLFDKKSADDIWEDITKGNYDKIKEAEQPKYEMIRANDISELPRKNREYTEQEDQEAINPNYKTSREYQVNCSYCTTAYEFRRRGYDVEAAPKGETDDPTYADELLSWYKGAEKVTMFDIKSKNETVVDKIKSVFSNDIPSVSECKEYLEDELKSYGEGARGNFMMHWNDDVGHSIVWEIKNGQVVFRDCQTNKCIYNIDDYLDRSSYFAYFRTDNLEFSDEALKTVRYKRKAGS